MSFRDVEDLLAEHGIEVSYESIRHWCARFGPEYAHKLKKRRGSLGDTWYLDDVFMWIGGELHYLWRAVEQDGDCLADAIEDCGETLDSMMAEAKKEFWAVCDEKFPGIQFELPDNSTIEVKLMEDRDGVTFAYRLMNGDERGTGSEQGKRYAEILKQIDPSFKSSGNYIGWFNPSPFVAGKRFLESDKKVLAPLFSDGTKMGYFVDDLIEQEEAKRQYFIDRVSA